jgi:hypothetical protein
MRNLSEADVTSFFDKVYTRPVLVLGSTSVNTLSVGTVRISWGSGYLKEVEGPFG